MWEIVIDFEVGEEKRENLEGERERVVGERMGREEWRERVWEERERPSEGEETRGV